MSLHFLRSRFARIVKAKPKPLGTLDWSVWCGLKPIPDMNAEIAPGSGITYADLAELPPQPDPLEVALARLHAEHQPKPPKPTPLALPPEEPCGVEPCTTTVDETTSYEPDYPPDPKPFAPENDDG